jgi:predicted O-methyltransferase YrrM
LTDAEGGLLFTLAATCRPGGTIVEIGSWKGKSTVWLASGARQSGARVFAIDPHEASHEDPAARTLDTLRRNLSDAGVLDLVTPIIARSENASRDFTGPIDVLFVDGDHTGAGVRRDLEQWLPKMATPGALALHDVVNPAYSGPRRAVARLLVSSRRIGRMEIVDSIAYASTVVHNRTADYAANCLMAVALRAYGLRPAHMPAPVGRMLAAIAAVTPLRKRRSHP